MQIIYLNYFLVSIISYLGLLLGVILIRLAPEEQRPGKRYFILIKKILFFLILVFLLFFYKIHAILSLVLYYTERRFFVMTQLGNVRVEIKSEIATSDHPACVLVYESDQLVAKVIAEVELKPGADGGYYHCVTLKKQ